MMTNDDYINAFKESRERVNRFGYISLKNNAKISILPQPPLDIREPDQGDMLFHGRIEHKVRALDFTSRDDYPFSTVIVDEVDKVDKKNDKVFMYVLENRTGTHAAVVYGFTQSSWKKEEKYDPKRERMCLNYEVDKSLVRFCKIEEVF